MSESDRDGGGGVSRRKVLECMTWVGTGVVWTVSGGVPRSLGIMGEAAAVEARGLTFLQISDSHIGFHLPPNPNALGTLEEAIAKVNALPKKPAFMIHTGDISHLSLEAQFDDADRIISQARLDVHYVPGEHDFLDPDRKFYVYCDLSLCHRLEHRVETLLRRKDWFVEGSQAYCDTETGKSRELDLSALYAWEIGSQKSAKKEKDLVWVHLLIECVNNAQPQHSYEAATIFFIWQ